MKVWIAGLLVALAAVTAHAATDSLAEARRFYNLGQYDNAARFARDAMKLPATTDGARLILGRIYLEQYRRSADQDGPDQIPGSAELGHESIAGGIAAGVWRSRSDRKMHDSSSR